MKKLFTNILVIVLISVNCNSLATVILKKAKSFTVIDNIIKQEISAKDIHSTLLVFDDDDTLMNMPTILGSSAWWYWQSHLLKSKNFFHAEADSISQLIVENKAIMSQESMMLTDTTIPNYLQQWKNAGYNLLIETARSSTFNTLTDQQLSQVKILRFFNNKTNNKYILFHKNYI